MSSKRLGDLLRESGVIKSSELEAALQMQRGTGDRIGSALVRLGVIDSGVLARWLGEQLGVEAVDPSTLVPEPEALAMVDLTTAMRLGCLPVEAGEDVLRVAMTDPADQGARRALEEITGLRVEAVVAPQMALYECVKRAYGVGHAGAERDRRLREIAVQLRGLAEELDRLLEPQA